MPAVRAAAGLAPTARSWKPVVLRVSSQDDARSRSDGDEQSRVQAEVGAEQVRQPGARVDHLGDRLVRAGSLEAVRR